MYNYSLLLSLCCILPFVTTFCCPFSFIILYYSATISVGLVTYDCIYPETNSTATYEI